MFGPETLAFIQVILLDLVLSGDNAVIIGTLAASLPLAQRNKAIVLGLLLAMIMRIIFSLGVTYLLQIPFILPIGGLLLFWVAWKMYKEIKGQGADTKEHPTPQTLGAALLAITLADISMSLDNVLAVAGAAGQHTTALVVGLVLSVVLMGFGAKLVSGLIDRFKWIAWVGLGLIIFIGARMIYEGLHPLLVHAPLVA